MSCAPTSQPGGVIGCVACCAPWHVHSAWLRCACLTAGPTAQRARDAVLCCYGRTPRMPSSDARDASTGKQAGRSHALPGGYRHDRTPSHSERQPARTAGDQSANRLLPQPGRLGCDRKPAHALRPDQQQQRHHRHDHRRMVGGCRNRTEPSRTARDSGKSAGIFAPKRARAYESGKFGQVRERVRGNNFGKTGLSAGFARARVRGGLRQPPRWGWSQTGSRDLWG